MLDASHNIIPSGMLQSRKETSGDPCDPTKGDSCPGVDVVVVQEVWPNRTVTVVEASTTIMKTVYEPSITTVTVYEEPAPAKPEPPTGPCCIFTWECAVLVNKDMDCSKGDPCWEQVLCCMEEYQLTCANPQNGPHVDVCYPPQCSNPGEGC